MYNSSSCVCGGLATHLARPIAEAAEKLRCPKPLEVAGCLRPCTAVACTDRSDCPPATGSSSAFADLLALRTHGTRARCTKSALRCCSRGERCCMSAAQLYSHTGVGQCCMCTCTDTSVFLMQDRVASCCRVERLMLQFDDSSTHWSLSATELLTNANIKH
jgi:hypothetical protein